MELNMDWWAKAHAYACGDSRLSDRDFRVYISVRLRAGDSGSCWESVETIGERAGNMSGRSARRSLEVLKRLGYLIEIADLKRKTGRRFEIARIVLPPRTDVVETPDRTVPPPRTELSANIEHGLEARIRTTKRTEKSSSSHDILLSGEEQSIEEVPPSSEVIQSIRRNFPEVVPKKIAAIVREFGPDVVEEASREFKSMNRQNEWAYFRGMCRKKVQEGGVTGRSTPKVLPSKTRPMRYFVPPESPSQARMNALLASFDEPEPEGK